MGSTAETCAVLDPGRHFTEGEIMTQSLRRSRVLAVTLSLLGLALLAASPGTAHAQSNLAIGLDERVRNGFDGRLVHSASGGQDHA
jgi:hypothetical protein